MKEASVPTITCITENTAMRGSSFWGEHGLSFLIETADGRLLFDTGQTSAVLLHNMALLGLSPQDIDAVALSHAHNDHTGGLPAILAIRPELRLFANADLGRPRFSRKEDRYQPIGMPLTIEQLAYSADLHLSAEPQEVLPGVWTTGEIVNRSEFEGRSPSHVVPDGDGWRPDPYQDDMSMVVETAEGLVLVLGCCHAGLLNTLAQVSSHFGHEPYLVVGGTHLAAAADSQLQRVVEVLQDMPGLKRIYPSHCSGERPYVALSAAFGDRVQPCPAGSVLTLE
jgi:7,8-dihydropterin-6-yl-methyl-4-(beta-D-ribofuranosyl)aminobenzene 5'-phosphate synthase